LEANKVDLKRIINGSVQNNCVAVNNLNNLKRSVNF
jgi:hypothetical protein